MVKLRPHCSIARAFKGSVWIEILLLVAGIGATSAALGRELQCGVFEFPKCKAQDDQFDPGFKKKLGTIGEFGGFGGGQCVASKTPVIFIHGNADYATDWDSPITGAIGSFPVVKNSVYHELKAQGYNNCELFGVSFLSKDERNAPQSNYHQPKKYQIILDFIKAVKTYTGKDQVDLVTHSLGVTMTLAALTYADSRGPSQAEWGSVHKFINIAGGIHGLNSCLYVGFENPVAATCGSENIMDRYTFGLFPDTGSFFGYNSWTGAEGPFSLRRAPQLHPKTDFYTITAGMQDEIHCTTLVGWADCSKGALFEPAKNVKAQLNIGAGTSAEQIDFSFKDWQRVNEMGGDSDGVGHFKAKNNAGEIIYQMLNSGCIALQCKGSYQGGPVVAE
jgi:pimeloyl-ACP methyl ester carboxylesterase